jgi:hypothetical protein
MFLQVGEECVEQEWRSTQQSAPSTAQKREQTWPPDVNLVFGIPVDPAIPEGLNALNGVFKQVDRAIPPHEQYQRFDADISSSIGVGEGDNSGHSGARLRPENTLSAKDIEVQVVKHKASQNGNGQSANSNHEWEVSHRQSTISSVECSGLQQEGFEQGLRNLSPQQASATSTRPGSQTRNARLRSVTESTGYTEVYTAASSQVESAGTVLSPCTSNQSSARLRKYPCGLDNCSSEFVTPGKLRKHRKSKHTPKEDWPYECSICGVKALWQGHLDKHVRSVHKKEIVGYCSECGAANTRKDNLIRHEGTCNGQKAMSSKPRGRPSSSTGAASSPASLNVQMAGCPAGGVVNSSTSSVYGGSNSQHRLQSQVRSNSPPETASSSKATPGQRNARILRIKR